MEKNLKKYIYIHTGTHTHIYIITELLCYTPETQYCKPTILQKQRKNY